MWSLYCVAVLVPLAVFVRLFSRKEFLNWLKSLQVFSYKRSFNVDLKQDIKAPTPLRPVIPAKAASA